MFQTRNCIPIRDFNGEDSDLWLRSLTKYLMKFKESPTNSDGNGDLRSAGEVSFQPRKDRRDDPSNLMNRSDHKMNSNEGKSSGNSFIAKIGKDIYEPVF